MLVFDCLFVSSLSLAEIRTRWWLHLGGRRKPTYNLVLNYVYQQQLSFPLAPHKLRIQEISIKIWWVFFFNLGGGWGRGVGGSLGLDTGSG